MKKILMGIFTFTLYGYFIVAIVIFTPYYNYKYARENGFVKWLLLGEVVPTLKAFAWPFYGTWKDSTQDKEDNTDYSKIPTDNCMAMCTVIFNQALNMERNNIDSVANFTEKLQSINKVFSKLPKDKLDSVKKFSVMFITRYSVSVRNIQRYICSLSPDNLPDLSINDSLIFLNKSMRKLCDKYDTTDLYSAYSQINLNNLPMKNGNFDKDKLKLVIEQNKYEIPRRITTLNDCYNRLFRSL